MGTSESERIRRHIGNFASTDPVVSRRAEGFLLRYYGVRALGQLIPACDHPLPMVRLRAVWVLGYTRDPRAFETILRLTDDPDERVRYDATIALGILGDARAIPHLYRMLRQARDHTRPSDMAFARMGLAILPTIKRALKESDSRVRQAAINIIGGFADDLGDPECIRLLRRSTKDPDDAVRSDAAFWLEKIEQKKATESFVSAD